MIGTVLPLALVVGLSPLPIMPVLLLLMTPRAGRNGPAFLAAWVVVLGALVAVAVWLGNLADPDPVTEEGIGWIQVVTGAVFLVMAAVKWLRGRRAGEPKEQPAWVSALQGYTPARSARLGALLAGANPKNLAMALAAGAEIAALASGPGATAGGILAFVLVGSVGVATPVLTHALLGERAAAGLERVRAWLERHGSALSLGVLVVLGALLVAKGLTAAT